MSFYVFSKRFTAIYQKNSELRRNCGHHWLPTSNYVNLLRLRISLWVLLEIRGQVELAPVCLQWVPVSMYIFSTIVISLVTEGIVMTDKFGCWQIPQNNCLIRGVKAIMGRRAKTLEFAPLKKLYISSSAPQGELQHTFSNKAHVFLCRRWKGLGEWQGTIVNPAGGDSNYTYCSRCSLF